MNQKGITINKKALNRALQVNCIAYLRLHVASQMYVLIPPLTWPPSREPFSQPPRARGRPPKSIQVYKDMDMCAYVYIFVYIYIYTWYWFGVGVGCHVACMRVWMCLHVVLHCLWANANYSGGTRWTGNVFHMLCGWGLVVVIVFGFSVFVFKLCLANHVCCCFVRFVHESFLGNHLFCDFVCVLYDYCCVDRCLCSLICFWLKYVTFLYVWARNKFNYVPRRFCLA